MRMAATLACAAAVMVSPSTQAQEVLKIGIVGPYTGPFAAQGQSFRHGIDAYMAAKGNMVGGRKLEVIYRDSAGSDPSLAKRLAEELVVKDKVSILGGFFLSPEAAAAAPVANEAKTPLLIFNAATPALMKMSPLFVRLGQAINQPAELTALHARQSGKSRGYVAVADLGPGHLVEQAFTAKFIAEGGQMAGNVRIPLNTADFAPFAERIANANPDVLQVFLPPGAASTGFVKALGARGMTKKMMIVGQGEAEDSDLPQFDDSVVGFQSIIYIDANATNPENKALSAWLQKNVAPTARPNPFNIGAYDGMHLAFKMIADQAGKPFDGEAAVKGLAGYSFRSPRGPVTIDPATRELVQNFYLREVVKDKNGVKFNTVVKTWENVKPTPLRN